MRVLVALAYTLALPAGVLLGSAACGDKKDAAPPAPSAAGTTSSASGGPAEPEPVRTRTAAPTASAGKATLSLEGAFTGELETTDIRCGSYDPKVMRSTNYRIVTPAEGARPELSVHIVDNDGDGPQAATLHVQSGKTSYLRGRGKGEVAAAADGSGATFDVELTSMSDSTPLHVKGSIRCDAKK